MSSAVGETPSISVGTFVPLSSAQAVAVVPSREKIITNAMSSDIALFFILLIPSFSFFIINDVHGDYFRTRKGDVCRYKRHNP